MSIDNSNKSAKGKKGRAEPTGDDVFQAPTIMRDPGSRQAKIGSKVVLRVVATGLPLPSYQWFHNGKKISGATMDRLVLNKIRRLAGGSYHCEVKNFVGKVASRAAMISFLALKIPPLVVEPKALTVKEGQPITLKVTSLNTEHLKQFKVFWIFDGKRIKGAIGPELKISAAKAKYAGTYKAMISTGGSLETSNAVAVIVQGGEAPIAAPEPILPSSSAVEVKEAFFNPEEEEHAGPSEELPEEFTKETFLAAPIKEPEEAQSAQIEEVPILPLFTEVAIPALPIASPPIPSSAEMAAAPKAIFTPPPLPVMERSKSEPGNRKVVAFTAKRAQDLQRKRKFLENFAQNWQQHCSQRLNQKRAA